ncbi:phage integrase SAM-like domain-containing protein [Adhaeribacter aquaticus]|uniref:phage integrase SAM-like domain-containing protein n=1 Tax=Adhaeribacter aquaticus TaxID=299567 RepID=UPI00040E3FF7|nr:phage integrase SAM-like domain-containing protein [Adhaeribacter aquaticus]
MAWILPERVRVSTKISINPKYWLPNSDLFVTNKHERFLYYRHELKELDGKLFSECARLRREGEPITKEALQQVIDPTKAPAFSLVKGTIKEIFYFGFWESLDKLNKDNELYPAWKTSYLRKEREPGKKTVIKNTQAIEGYDAARKGLTIVNWLEKFRKGLRPKDFNPQLLQKYYDFLEENTEIEDNTLIKHQSFIRMILSKANLPYEWVEVHAYAEPQNFDLFWHEVVQLQEANYSNKELQEAAHTFVIDVQLCLRWSDLSTLKPEHFQEYYSQKHGHFKVVNKDQVKTQYGAYVPVPPRAAALIEQHGKIPVPATQEGKAVLNYYNKRIKAAAMEAGLDRLITIKKTINKKAIYSQEPLYKVISSHNVRHTAASRMYEVTGNDALKERLLGHKAKYDPYTLQPAVKLANDLLDGWALVEAEGVKPG